jgi:hypothetical protein
MKKHGLKLPRIVASIAVTSVLILVFSSSSLAAWSKPIKLQAKIEHDYTCPDPQIALVATNDGRRYCAFGGGYDPWLGEHIDSVITLKGRSTSRDDPRNAQFEVAFDFIDITKIDGVKAPHVNKGPSAFWQTVGALAGVNVYSPPPDTQAEAPDASAQEAPDASDQPAADVSTQPTVDASAQVASISQDAQFVRGVPQCGSSQYDNRGNFYLMNRCNIKITITFTNQFNGLAWGTASVPPGTRQLTESMGNASPRENGTIWLYACPGTSTAVAPDGRPFGNHYNGAYTCQQQ